MKKRDNEKKGRRGRKLIQWLILAVLLGVGGYFLHQYTQRPDQATILEVNDEKISISEAMVYYKLMELEFERMGSEEIWDLEILGLEPEQTAMDRVMESMIRIKAIKASAGELSAAEEARLDSSVTELAKLPGDEYCKQHYIDKKLLEKIVQENYLAYRYEEEATFLPGSNESEIREKLQQTFARYDNLNVEQYTRTIRLKPMMFYTGEWVEGEWVTYSEAQKAVILEKVLRIYENLDSERFAAFSNEFADSTEVEDNPIFAEGAVQHPRIKHGAVYFGQMEQSVAEKILHTPIGSVSELIETKYGYLIVQVVSLSPASSYDMKMYEELLQEAKEAYEGEIIEQLKSQRMEEEWQRLEKESSIVRSDAKWEAYMVNIS